MAESISTVMSDEELRLARIHDAVNRSGLDATTTLDLVCGLIEDHFNGGLDEEKDPHRFRKMIEEGADVSLDKLGAVVLDPDRFPHRNEKDYSQQLDRMRKRVRELTEGVAWNRVGGSKKIDLREYNIHPEKDLAPKGRARDRALRKLREDAPELHARTMLPKGHPDRLTPHGAMVRAGFWPRTFTVRPEPTSAARTLRKHMTPEQCAELARLLTGEANT